MILALMFLVTSHLSAATQASAWRTFAFSLVFGVVVVFPVGRSLPLFSGLSTPPPWARFAVLALPLGLVAVYVVARLAQQGIPGTIGYILGADVAILILVVLSWTGQRRRA